MEAFCRRFIDHGLQGVEILDIAANGQHTPVEQRRDALITDVAVAFIQQLANSCSVSVSARGEATFNPADPRIIDVFVTDKER